MVSSAGQEAAELAASAGLQLDPWQIDVLDIALGERPDGKWAARQVGLIVPRQNGKGSVLEALELACLFLFGDRLILHSAHEFKTAAEAYLRIKSLIEQTPDLDRRVARMRNAHGDEGIELKSGQRLRFVARTGGSGRGFSGDKIILDEAYNLSDRMVSALGPTMSARPNPQVWFTSSAPLDDECSNVLRRVCKRGREGDRSLAYMEFCSADDADLDDPEAQAESNPGYPHRITDEAIQNDRSLMLPSDFARERMGIWDPDQEVAQAIPAEHWSATADDNSRIDGAQTFALEVAEDRSWSSFGAAGKSTLGNFIHVEVADTLPGTAGTVARAKALTDKWGGSVAVAKGSPAASLIPEMRAAGVKVDEISTEDHARDCGQLYDGVVNGTIRHRHQPALDVAVRGAVRREVGDGAWAWSRRRSSVDISPLVAVTLAAGKHGLAAPPVDLASQIF